MVIFTKDGITPNSPENLNNLDPDALRAVNDILSTASNVEKSGDVSTLTPVTYTLTNTTDTSSYDQELVDIKQQYKLYYNEDPELCTVLRKLSLGEVMIVKVIETFTIQKVKQIILIENPYRLMDVEGFGFSKSDNVAHMLGIQNEDPRRQRALIQSVLETNKSFGNTYLHTTILEKECKKQNVSKFTERLTEMIEKGEVILDENRIYLKRLYDAECEVCDMIRVLIGKDVITHKYREPILAKMDLKSKAAEIDNNEIPF
jgi:hypothetical protein